MVYAKHTGWKRPKKVQATRRENLARWADEEVDLFKSDLTWRAQKRREKEVTRDGR